MSTSTESPVPTNIEVQSETVSTNTSTEDMIETDEAVDSTLLVSAELAVFENENEGIYN